MYPRIKMKILFGDVNVFQIDVIIIFLISPKVNYILYIIGFYSKILNFN